MEDIKQAEIEEILRQIASYMPISKVLKQVAIPLTRRQMKIIFKLLIKETKNVRES